MRDIVNQFKNVTDDIGKKVCQKTEQVLRKNPGYSTLSQMADKMTDDVVDLTSSINYYKYAPLVSADVERSFSMYKTLLADNRKSFTFANLQKILVIYYNAAE